MQVATNAETTQQEETKQDKQQETKEIKQEPKEESKPKLEKFQEDLTLPEKTVLDVEVIKDWPKRFEAADYSQEQRDMVGLCLKTKDVWLQMHDATDWKAHHSDKDKGIEIFTREGPRKILQMKAFGILPFTPLQVFRVLADGAARLEYDENIAESRLLKKPAANTLLGYERSKAKGMFISSRDFVLCKFSEKVRHSLFLCVILERGWIDNQLRLLSPRGLTALQQDQQSGPCHKGSCEGLCSGKYPDLS